MPKRKRRKSKSILEKVYKIIDGFNRGKISERTLKKKLLNLYPQIKSKSLKAKVKNILLKI